MTGVARSQALVQWMSPAAGYSPAFVSPAGWVTLVKALHVYNQSGVAARIVLATRNAAASVAVNNVDTEIAVGATYEWNGWIVLNPGDQVNAYTDQVDVSVWISGAVLAGPNQFPPA